MTDPNYESILVSIKKTLGIQAEMTVFDPDVIMHINSTFLTLNQLGIGPTTGFIILDSTALWSDFTSDITRLAALKTYVYFKTRLSFDPPATSFTIASMEKMIAELEWRLNVEAETINPPSDPFTGVTPITTSAYIWDLTGLTDFPAEAAIGDLGIDMTTGDVWRKTA